MENVEFYKSHSYAENLDVEQIEIFNEAKNALSESSINLPNEIIAWYVIAKKTSQKVVAAVKAYVYWINVIDFATIPWEYIEALVRSQFLTIPHKPFSTAKNGSVCIFLNSYKLDPKYSGARLLIAFQWTMIHFLLSRSNSIASGVCAIVQMGGMSYSKFYPQVQKPILNSLQSVLPLRMKKINIIDAPFIFWAIWEVVSLWLSAKFVSRVSFLSSKESANFVPKTKSPSFVGGNLEYNVETLIPELKHFYENEFRDVISKFVEEMPKEILQHDMWEVPQSFKDSLNKKSSKK